MNSTAVASVRVLEIAFTGYPVTDVARARSFYEGLLGLKATSIFDEGNRAWIEYEIGASTLAISNVSEEWRPSSQGPAVALEVEDFDAAVAALRAAGATFALEPIASPVCRMTVVLDPDGNSVLIHKRTPNSASTAP